MPRPSRFARLYLQFTSLVTPRRIVIGTVLLLIIAAAALALRASGAAISATMIRAWLMDLGLVGPLALILILAGVLVVPVIPASVFQVGAGLAFGPILGLGYALVADWLGASAGFWIGRGWGRALLERYLSPQAHQRLVGLTRRMSWKSVVILRLLPGPAYPLVSLAAGHSHLPYVEYIVASLGGVAPVLALLVLAGDLLESSPWLGLALVVLILASVALAGHLLRTTEPEVQDLNRET